MHEQSQVEWTFGSSGRRHQIMAEFVAVANVQVNVRQRVLSLTRLLSHMAIVRLSDVFQGQR